MSISGDQNSPTPHAPSRRTSLAGSTVAAGALAGSAFVPGAAHASHGSHGSHGAEGILPPQWPDGRGT